MPMRMEAMVTFRMVHSNYSLSNTCQLIPSVK
jgi:hypothetical protein